MNQEPTADQLKPVDVPGRKGTGERVYDFLNKTGFTELRKSDEKFEGWIHNTTFDEFTSYLTRLNGIILNKPIKHRTMSGSRVRIGNEFIDMGSSFHTPLFTEDKMRHLEDVFNAVKRIPDNKDRALLAFYSLQNLHLFPDGNGRTGRLLYKLISNSGKQLSKEDLSELLDHEEGELVGPGRDIFEQRVSSPETFNYYAKREVFKKFFAEEFSEGYRGIFSFGQAGDIEWPREDKLSEGARAAVREIFSEVPDLFAFRSLAVLKFLKDKGILDQYKRDDSSIRDGKEATPEDVGGKLLRIEADLLMRELSDDDVRSIGKIYRELDKVYFTEIIDIFENPQAHQIQSNTGEVVTLKSVLS